MKHSDILLMLLILLSPAISVCLFPVVQNVSVPGGSSWSQSLAEYIRNNDQTMITQSDALVAFYEQKLLVTETMQQYAEATGMSEGWEGVG